MEAYRYPINLLSDRKPANIQRRTSPIGLRSLRSRAPPMMTTTGTTTSPSSSLRSRSTKATTSVKAPRHSLPQHRAPSSMSSSAKSRRRFTRTSVTPMILRSARI
ncbi:unnamed protein product [Hydatigera taeniaeformis]|uniref:Uncharacterized protein n=1 Tax=Hydatigena taeniaeformis TaxID=6205 RepID=A0A0R3WW92_HYDTA|nr:unnamed protein product [Hydatigera taeniaeformis]